MSQVSLSFPDSTYTSSNKPSADTLKSDLSAIEIAHNDTDTYAIKTTTSNLSSTSFFLDEDDMATNSNQKVASQQSIKAYVDAQIASAITTAKSALFPVGSIYTNITGTNPATELGFGTWTAFGAGRVIVGYNSGDADFNAAEKTGGAKTVTLTAAQSGLVAHTHTQAQHRHAAATGTFMEKVSSGGTLSSDAGSTVKVETYTDYSTPTINSNSAASASEAHSNVQPYIVAHVWKRTA